MARHSALAEKQRRGHFPVRPTLGDQSRDAPLSSRQALLASAPSEPAELRSSLRRPAQCSDLFEPRECGLDRFASGALLTSPTADGAEREQGARASIGIAYGVVLSSGLRQ